MLPYCALRLWRLESKEAAIEWVNGHYMLALGGLRRARLTAALTGPLPHA